MLEKNVPEYYPAMYQDGYTPTEILAAMRKKLRQNDEFAPLLAQHGAEMTGRGRNVKIELKMKKCA